MAYEVKYRCEFTDVQGDDWRYDILEDSYAGAILTMTASADPLNIEWLTPGDDLTLNPIKGSMCTMNIECDTNFQYIGLYDEENMVRKVQIYCNDVIYWRGWISNDYTEPYDTPPYTVSLAAADGLGLLKNIEYKDEFGNAYTDRVTESKIILIVLNEIGVTQFTEFCNLYEDRIGDAVDDSVFDQTYIDNDIFIGAECYSVLEAILFKYNAIIRQWNGELIIYRPSELVGDTVYGRVITSVSTTGTSIAPDKVIDRVGDSLIDVNGGLLGYQVPMSSFTAKQNYDYVKSWVKNHDFAEWDFLAGFDGWTKVGSFGMWPVKDGGVVFMPAYGSTGPSESHYIYQNFGEYGKQSATDVLRVKFGYEIDNQTGITTAVEIKVAIYDSTYIHNLSMLNDTELFQWDNGSYNRIHWTVSDVPTGSNSYTFDQSVVGIPCDGGFQVRLYYTKENTYLTIKEFQFAITSDQLNTRQDIVKKWIIPGLIRYTYMRDLPVEVIDKEEVVGRVYTASNDIQGTAISQDYMLGDCEDTGIINVLEQFTGSLAIEIGGSLSQTAINFVNDFYDDYYSGGVILSSDGGALLFTSSVAGTDFTGSTSIANVSGNLTGTASTVTANSAGTKQKKTFNLAGTTGDFSISYNFIDHTQSYNTSLADTVLVFDANYSATFLTYGITVTHSGTTIIFEETVADGGFGGYSLRFTSDPAGDMDGEWLSGSPYDIDPLSAVARVDKIALTGTTGTATVTCDAEVQTVTFDTNTVFCHTASWHTRGNTEALPLAELIAEEVADLYSKGRQFIQMNMIEAGTSLDMTQNLQDPLNVVGANNRVFAINRGTLDVRNRQWTIDMIEIGDK
jgi:hypothetical protein